MTNKDEFDLWYYNRLQQFFENLLAPMYKRANEPTINDLKKNDEESNV